MKITASLLVLAVTAPSYGADLTFDLRSPPTAVALQFDVTSTSPESLDLGPPQLVVASPHTVQSAVVPSGATRFVVYSTAGEALSPGGTIRVTFESQQPLQNGMLQVTGVVASNSTGQLVGTAGSNTPNALPALAEPAATHRSAEIGIPITLSASAIRDPDGLVASVDHRVGGVSRGVSNALPFSIPWTPSTSGLAAHTALATDNIGGISLLSLGNIHAYSLSDLTSFAAFGQIHYGSSADPAWYEFGADPFGIGLKNGLAYFLGINPRSPDRSRLPQGKVEDFNGQPHFVFRFIRSGSQSDVFWNIWETPNLSGWQAVPGAQVQFTPLGDGRTEVVVRPLLASVGIEKLFMQLGVQQP